MSHKMIYNGRFGCIDSSTPAFFSNILTIRTNTYAIAHTKNQFNIISIIVLMS